MQVGFEPEPDGVQGDPLGEGEDAFDVELVFPHGVTVDLGQGHGFAELVEVLLVGGLIDRFLEDEGFDELLFPALQLEQGFLGGGSLGREIFFAALPDVEDDPAEEGEEFGARPEMVEVGEEVVFEGLPGDVGAAATGVGRAVVVGVALFLALGPGAGEGLPAVAAGQEAPQGKVRIVALFGHDQAVGAEEALAFPKGFFVDQGRPVAGGVDAPSRLDDPADVEAARQHLSPLLR